MHLLVNKEFNIAFVYHTLCALGRSKPGGFFLSTYAWKPFWRWKVGLDCPDLDKNREKVNNKDIFFFFLFPHILLKFQKKTQNENKSTSMLESQEGCHQPLRTFIFGLYIADGNTVAAGKSIIYTGRREDLTSCLKIMSFIRSIPRKMSRSKKRKTGRRDCRGSVRKLIKGCWNSCSLICDWRGNSEYSSLKREFW